MYTCTLVMYTCNVHLYSSKTYDFKWSMYTFYNSITTVEKQEFVYVIRWTGVSAENEWCTSKINTPRFDQNDLKKSSQ